MESVAGGSNWKVRSVLASVAEATREKLRPWTPWQPYTIDPAVAHHPSSFRKAQKMSRLSTARSTAPTVCFFLTHSLPSVSSDLFCQASSSDRTTVTSTQLGYVHLALVCAPRRPPSLASPTLLTPRLDHFTAYTFHRTRLYMVYHVRRVVCFKARFPPPVHLGAYDCLQALLRRLWEIRVVRETCSYSECSALGLFRPHKDEAGYAGVLSTCVNIFP